MRRVLQLLGLSGFLVTGFVSIPAIAQEATDTDAQQLAEEPKAEHPAPVAAAAAVVAPAAEAVAPVAKPKVGDMTTHGYFRGGLGANVAKKGRQSCFQLALTGGLLAKYRLGNECEVWAEMEFTSVAYAGEDGSVARLHFMPVAFIPTTHIGYTPTGVTSSDQGSPGTGATVAFPNLYVDMKGISWLFGGTAWVGTRYYKRESVYINDFFYWNPSGVGAGVEDINLGGDLRLSYGVFAVDGQPNGSPQLPMQYGLGIRNDLQLRGIRPWESAELQFGFQYIADWSGSKTEQGDTVAPTHGGWGATAQFIQDALGGTNKLAVQFGKGGGTGFGTLARFYYPDFSLQNDPAESRLRVVDVLTIQPTADLGAQLNVIFQRDNSGTGQSGAVTTWISAGTRLSYALADHAKLLGEVGYDRVKKSNGADLQWLAKFTIAPTIAGAKGFWGRPELRLFYTWAMWSQAAAGATVDSDKLYTYADPITGKYTLSGSIVGLQAEAMW